MATLPNLPGIDIQTGMTNVRGKETLYLKILQTFRTSQGDFATRYAAAREANDRETATRLAHTLKGAAGTIGAIALAQAASTLQHASSDGSPDIEAILGTVVGELDRVLGGLAQLG